MYGNDGFDIIFIYPSPFPYGSAHYKTFVEMACPRSSSVPPFGIEDLTLDVSMGLLSLPWQLVWVSRHIVGWINGLAIDIKYGRTFFHGTLGFTFSDFFSCVMLFQLQRCFLFLYYDISRYCPLCLNLPVSTRRLTLHAYISC